MTASSSPESWASPESVGPAEGAASPSAAPPVPLVPAEPADDPLRAATERRPAKPLAICVYCSSSTAIDRSYVELAADVGAELARRGHTLVSGGGSISCMGAVARAARAGGARTIGVIPVPLLDREITDMDADELIVTSTMRERKAIMDERADAFLALPGGIGTLEELLEVWVARTLGIHAKPVVVLDPDGLFAGLRTLVDDLVTRRFVRPWAAGTLRWAGDVGSALDLVEAPTVPVVPGQEEQLEGE